MGPRKEYGRRYSTGTIVVLTLIVCLYLFAPAVATAAEPHKTTDVGTDNEFVAGEIILLFDDGTDPAAAEKLILDVGGEISETSNVNPLRYVIKVPEREEDDYIDKYVGSDIIVAAEKNYILKALREPEKKLCEPVKKNVVAPD